MAPDDQTAPLSPAEARAWGPFVLASLNVLAQLDAELKAHCDLSHLDFGILTLLSFAPDRQLRMSALARSFGVDPSTITVHIRQLRARGFVSQQHDPNDGRVHLAALTEAGLAALQAAQPIHHAGVRRYFLNHLSPDHLAMVEAIFGHLRAVQEQGPAGNP